MKYNNIRVKSAIAASTDISCFSWDGTLGWNIIIYYYIYKTHRRK